MSIYTLGLNIYHADSSSCLMKNGRLVCAYEEERLNRVKHWAGIPFKAISECLKHEKINLIDIKFITVNSNPYSNLKEKLLYTFNSKNIINDATSFLKRQSKKLTLKNELERYFNINLIVADEEEIETVGGLVFSKINRIPKSNEEFNIDNIINIKILRANERKILTVHITKLVN